jgi:hypothetical protein
MKKRLTMAVLVVLPVLVAAGIAVAADAFDGAKTSTARFHDLEQAKAAGYVAKVVDLGGIECIAQAGQGAMGVHMLNPALLFDDGTIDAANPELLVYERRSNGTLKLVALEYLVFQSEWKGAGKPSLFGQDFDEIKAGNRYGIPPSWALHAWIWKPNPSGVLYAWNPHVDCGPGSGS